ncbi:hypothetical protein CDD83_8706 [Cordyceps sp. RAO-2017]|nr:hypothetical protein CDD83_8706 [Cordyceps sp. RAO-2017]
MGEWGGQSAPQQQYYGQQPQYGQPPQQYGQPPHGQYPQYGQHPDGYNSYPQEPPPQYSFHPPQPNDDKYTFDSAFKVQKPKYNDVWAGILLILVFCGYVVISAVTINGAFFANGRPGRGIYDNSNDFSLNSNTIILFAFVLVVALVFSYAYVWLARIFPKQFIWLTGILNICWALGTALFYLYKRYWSAGIVFLIMAVFTIVAFLSWRSRIPFSALMLKTTITVSKRYGHVYLVSLLGGLVAIAFSAWYAVTLVAIYVRYQPARDNPQCGPGGGGCGRGKVIGLIVYVTFAMYFLSEWIKYTIHATIAGVYGSWYFSPHNFPKAATRGAARRALTYGFGSISLGSLLIAIVQFLRQICSVARSQAADDGGIGGIVLYVVFCLLSCLLGLLEWMVEFVNRYSIVAVALYNKAYFPAAKDTWKMIKDRGIDALVQQCLIGPVLSFGALFIALACTLFSYLYLILTKPQYNADGGYTPFVLAFAFLIGFQIANIFTTPLSSGIDTLFVAMGWDPQILISEHPELFQEMVRVYPQVQQAIQLR